MRKVAPHSWTHTTRWRQTLMVVSAVLLAVAAWWFAEPFLRRPSITAPIPTNATTMPTHDPFFKLGTEERQKLIHSARGIRVGDSEQSVIAKLGRPDLDKYPRPAWPSKRRTHAIEYFIVIYEEGFVNEIHDENVEIFIDPNDRIVRRVEIKTRSESEEKVPATENTRG